VLLRRCGQGLLGWPFGRLGGFEVGGWVNLLGSFGGRNDLLLLAKIVRLVVDVVDVGVGVGIGGGGGDVVRERFWRVRPLFDLLLQ
jgi:hypothetical protein